MTSDCMLLLAVLGAVCGWLVSDCASSDHQLNQIFDIAVRCVRNTVYKHCGDRCMRLRITARIVSRKVLLGATCLVF